MSKILIVDDSITEITRYIKLLEKIGHEVIMASCGEDGVEMAKSHSPDLILMDIVMPGLNGFQATRQLSRDSNTKDIPVIMITTKGQETDKVWAKRQGAKAYLTKPVSDNLLQETIHQVMG